jgi:hypothetical protein
MKSNSQEPKKDSKAVIGDCPEIQLIQEVISTDMIIFFRKAIHLAKPRFYKLTVSLDLRIPLTIVFKEVGILKKPSYNIYEK